MASASRLRDEAPRLVVGVTETAIGGPDRLASLAALFPHVSFVHAGPAWPTGRALRLDILIVSVAASSSVETEQAILRLRERPASLQIVIVLQDADVVTTRRLLHEGAADVLPAPVGEPALAVCIERLIGDRAPSATALAGQMTAFLKAGGGVGATTLAAQTACLLGRRAQGRICLADLDLQYGAGALYLDLPEALTVADVLGAGSSVADTPFATALPTHQSGARILAAPRDITPLEAMTPQLAEALIAGLKRDFALTIVDLPSVWTSWTNRVLQLADRLVLVTQLSVPHIQLVKRQLRIIAAQGLDELPLTLVVNGLTAERQSQVSLKAAERAIGRGFDVRIPEDRRTMQAAINEGLEIGSVRRGAKLERAIAELAAATFPASAASPEPRPR